MWPALLTPFLLFSAFLLLLLVSLSVPIIKTLWFFGVTANVSSSLLNSRASADVHFGLWGYCVSAVDVSYVNLFNWFISAELDHSGRSCFVNQRCGFLDKRNCCSVLADKIRLYLRQHFVVTPVCSFHRLRPFLSSSCKIIFAAVLMGWKIPYLTH